MASRFNSIKHDVLVNPTATSRPVMANLGGGSLTAGPRDPEDTAGPESIAKLIAESLHCAVAKPVTQSTALAAEVADNSVSISISLPPAPTVVSIVPPPPATTSSKKATRSVLGRVGRVVWLTMVTSVVLFELGTFAFTATLPRSAATADQDEQPPTACGRWRSEAGWQNLTACIRERWDARK